MNFKGDTFWRTFKLKYENAPYQLHNGDVVKSAFINNDGVKFAEKTINITETMDNITIEWSDTEMADVYSGEYILETEFLTADFRKTVQESVLINKDYIL